MLYEHKKMLIDHMNILIFGYFVLLYAFDDIQWYYQKQWCGVSWLRHHLEQSLKFADSETQLDIIKKELWLDFDITDLWPLLESFLCKYLVFIFISS